MQSSRFAIAARRPVYGLSLIELLVVIAIVGLLGAIGYPSYMDYVTRTNRTAAKSVLVQVSDRQEQFFADNKRYANDLTALGYMANGFAVDSQGAPLPTGHVDSVYEISLSDTTPTTFTVNAAPAFRQATHDTACLTLTLSHTGRKSQTGPGNGCW